MATTRPHQPQSPEPGPSSLPSMSSQTMTNAHNPDSDHTELYYTDLEDEVHAESEDTATSSDDEEQTAPPRKFVLKRAVNGKMHGTPPTAANGYGKGVRLRPAEDRKGKGVAFVDADSDYRPTRETQEEKKTWYDLDLSLIVALVSPVGNWLTGSDHIKNLFLILLLIFYLHQLIEMPWQLYHASRPRKPSKRIPRKTDSQQATLSHLAHTELQKQEVFYLSLAVISPLVGATLIRYVLTALEGVDNLSWFSTTLFVLATGIRPWSHLIGRLQERTHELHDTVHYPAEESEARHQMEIDRTLQTILRRLDALDATIQDMEEKTDKMEPMKEVCDDLSEAVGAIERTMSRSERKAEATRVTQDTRINCLETGLVELEGRRRRDLEAMESRFRISTYTHLYSNSHPQVTSFLARLLAVPGKLNALVSAYVGTLVGTQEIASAPVDSVKLTSLRRTATLDDTTTPPFLTRLETIPEAEDSDSEGTYVSDKDSNDPSATPAKKTSTPKGSRSRSRSVSNGRKKGGRRTASPQSKVVGYAMDVVSWPYKSAMRILAMIAPPVQKLFW
ncbi:hypothetical protein EIP91_006179 [Steccherinum ochraceum]|uniref:Uncharacterized protein n=1 Tax=Steccherinum ochraceum TaxID=92696 RepID=A0A4R0R6E5_9APHY|nr:hypothetical protein EIP91_006179 [Steccherinum ochraceum]